MVLGASNGIGRSMARQYAERGARVCIVGRREALVNEAVVECQSVGYIVLSSDKQENIFGVAADFANVDDMIRTRTIIEASKVQDFTRVRLSQLIIYLFFETIQNGKDLIRLLLLLGYPLYNLSWRLLESTTTVITLLLYKQPKKVSSV